MLRLAFGLMSVLLAASAAAQLSPDQQAEFNRRMAIMQKGVAVMMQAERAAHARCSSQPETFKFSSAPMDLGKPAGEMRSGTIAVTSWSGQCVDGKREGRGVLDWTVERNADALGQHLVTWKAEGSFVKGEKAGLWCVIDYKSQFSARPDISNAAGADNILGSCTLVTGNERNPMVVPSYKKGTDGRWQLWSSNGPASPPTFLPAGALEAESDRILTALAAGRKDVKVALVVRHQALDDLVRGARITLELSGGPISLKGKRVAVVLSTQSIEELERFRKERAALIAASASLTGPAAQHRARFIQASDPDRLLVRVAQTLRRLAREVVAADDLSILQKGGADYALVLDWKHLSRFDLLDKYDAFPKGDMMPGRAGKLPTLAGESIGALLISPQMKAVKQIAGSPHIAGRRDDLNWPGNEGYFGELANFYASGWGIGPDNIGTSLSSLEFQLKY